MSVVMRAAFQWPVVARASAARGGAANGVHHTYCARRTMSQTCPARDAGEKPRPSTSAEAAGADANPWDALFATESTADESDANWLSDWGAALDRESSCKPEFMLNDGESSWQVHRPPRREQALTRGESRQFRRIFDLLAKEKSPELPVDRPLGMFASRNELLSDSVLIRGGGMGKRFEELRDGIAAKVTIAEMDTGTDRIWSEIFEQQSAHDVWRWAEDNVWAPGGTYGVSTPFFAPALHLVFLSLRDRFRMPHAALAVYHHTRAQGEHAFMLGCTVSMFAEVIRTSWMCFRDAHGVLAYVNEARRVGLLSKDKPRRMERQIANRIETIKKEMRAAAMRSQLPIESTTDIGLIAAAQDLLQIEHAIGFAPSRRSAPRPPREERKKGKKHNLFILPAYEGLLRERIGRK